MIASQRLVRRLKVCAPDDTLARRGAILIEDALSTASLPGNGGGMVIIRRLPLGRIRATAAAAQVALRIEQRLRELASNAVYALDPSASGAPAVYFRDAGEAAVALTLKVARGEAPGEWFWRKAIPSWAAGSTRDHALRTLVRNVARLEGAPIVMAALIRALAAQGTCDVVCASLRPEDGDELLRALGWVAPPSWSPAAAHGVAIEIGDSVFTNTLDTWKARWGSDDRRTLWLAAAILLADHRVSAGSSALVRRSIQLIHQRAAPNVRPAAKEKAEPRQDAVRRPADTRIVLARIATTVEDATATPDQASPTLVWQPTQAAGLPFLINALGRMGIAELLERQPDLDDCGLHARVLLAVADRTDVPDDDPIRAALSPASDNRPSLPRLIDVSVLGLARWCRRHARLRLRDVICRPGRLLASDTHLDVALDPRSADIRVRRAGLDLDPGWVPWLGRVVTFHYSYE